MTPSDLKIKKQEILDIIFQSNVRLTAQAYVKAIKARFSIPFSEAKMILQVLVDEQELSYHYIYGNTYIEKSFLRPVRVSDRFILTPPGFKGRSSQDDIEIFIEPGISFGSGQHPTTVLCLKAIEFCFFEPRLLDVRQHLFGADIGTGSGVLAVAMCLSGLAVCHAYEIDPVSICEAEKNVALNQLAQRIKVIETPMDMVNNRFSIICANLRFPTLALLSDMICASLTQTGVVVLSGVRDWEKAQLLATYSKKSLEPVWQQDDKNWSAFVLKKKSC